MSNNKKPMARFHNTETGEIIDREMNDEEFAQYKADQKAAVDFQTELIAKAAAKAALLEKLGITAEEAVLLLS